VRPVGTLLRAIVAGALLGAGCGSAAGHVHDEGDEHETPVCEPGFTTPGGFTRTESFEDPYADHVGIRLGFVDGEGRELHYFAGIPGEFGEGLPLVDRVEAAGWVEGPLQGEDQTWVLSWRIEGPCGIRAVLGHGFTRQDFLETIREAGIVPRV
jgi:hypothetical protein